MTERSRDWFSPLLLAVYLVTAIGFIGLVCFGVFHSALPDRSASSQPSEVKPIDVAPPAQARAHDRAALESLPRTLRDSVQDDWSVESTWFNEVPKNELALTVRLESNGRLTEYRQVKIGGDRVEHSRDVDEERRMKMLAAVTSAIENFTLESEKRGKAHDVPRVTLSIRSGAGEIQLEFDNGRRVPEAVDAAMRRLVEASANEPVAPPANPRNLRFMPRPGMDWQITMTIRDSAASSVEWSVNEDRELSVHGELVAEAEGIVGWYSATLEDAAIQEILAVSCNLFNDFRFRPKLNAGAEVLDVSLSIRCGDVAIRIREGFNSPKDLSASRLGGMLKVISRDRTAAFARRLPPELVGELPPNDVEQ